MRFQFLDFSKPVRRLIFWLAFSADNGGERCKEAHSCEGHTNRSPSAAQVPLANGICNNQLNTPCGGTGIAFGVRTASPGCPRTMRTPVSSLVSLTQKRAAQAHAHSTQRRHADALAIDVKGRPRTACARALYYNGLDPVHLAADLNLNLNFMPTPQACHADYARCRPTQGKVLGYLKFMITQQRVPVSAVSMTINGRWQSLKRSGDGYWQATQYDVNNPQARAIVRWPHIWVGEAATCLVTLSRCLARYANDMRLKFNLTKAPALDHTSTHLTGTDAVPSE